MYSYSLLLANLIYCFLLSMYILAGCPLLNIIPADFSPHILGLGFIWDGIPVSLINIGDNPPLNF